MKPIDWLLQHLDEPDVSEIVLGIGRPAVVRSSAGIRTITSMNFGRTDIETLVAGTPLSGLIGSPVSIAPTEMDIDARRLVVEVVRQGYDAALRIAYAPGGRSASPSTPPPRSGARTGTTTPPANVRSEARTSTPPFGVPSTDDVPPPVSVRMTRSTVEPRTVTPTAPPRVGGDEPPAMSVRMTRQTLEPRTITPLPGQTSGPAIGPTGDEPPAASVRMNRSTILPRTVTPTPQQTSSPAINVPGHEPPAPSGRAARTTIEPRTVTPSPRTSSPTNPPFGTRPMTPSTPPPFHEDQGAPHVPSRSTRSTIHPPRSSTPTTPPRSLKETSAPRALAPFVSQTTPPPFAETPYEPPAPAPTPSFAYEVEPELDDHQRRYAAALGGEGEIEDVEEEAVPDFDAGVPYDYSLPEAIGDGQDWYGPQIVDEASDISAIHALLEAAALRNASDLHVIAKQQITIRRLGELGPLDVGALAAPFDRAVHGALFGPIAPTMAERFLLPLLGPFARKRLDELGYVDVGFEVPNRGRVRANISRQQDGLAGTFRLGRATPPTLDTLGLPHDLEKVVRHHQGLVVIAGPSGHGKTTTMAALVDLLNTANSDHIITIEDPVEIEHPAKKAIVSHREVGRHTLSFVSALKASLREDPDVIVIGELRDRETVEIALTAAETGHLVLATISTPSAVKTIDRLIDMFPPDDQIQVRASISGTLRAVIAQRLLPNIRRDGMVAAIELVTGVLPLATMIRDNKLFQLPSLMQRGRAFGMIRLDDSLAELVRAKRITEEVALAAAENKRELAALLSPRAAAGAPTLVKGLFGGKGPS